MKLHDEPFNKIKSGKKRIEMRLYDDKRRLIKVGDTIRFVNRDTEEYVDVAVINTYIFKNFEELYSNFDKGLLGYSSNEIANSNDMNKYYSFEEQSKYGVIAIEIKLH